MSKYREFFDLTSQLLSEMVDLEKSNYQEWLDGVQQAMESGELAVKSTDRLLELAAKDGHMRVNFNDALVSLIRDASELSMAGYSIPAKIMTILDATKNIYRYGIVLKQIAHFYNSIDRQMIPSQQPMLLDLALAFEGLIKNEKTKVTWGSAGEVEAYVARLQQAVKILSSTNRYLRKQHQAITELVLRLFQTNLLRNQPKWKDILGEIRSIMVKVQEEARVRPECMQAWYLHWDHQLYKALEFQWRLGVETMQASQGDSTTSFFDMEVELVYRSGQLQLKPTTEEIRSRYYREMKKFLSIPINFKGVNLGDSAKDSGSLFPKILETNGTVLAALYQSAEKVFQKLSKITNVVKDWSLLPLTADLEQVMASQLKEVADWETNFKFVKSKGKDAESIPAALKVEGIAISTQKMKSSIDDFLQRYFDSLVSSLRKAATQHLAVIEQFIISGTETLTQKPTSIEEIAAANRSHEEIRSHVPAIRINFELTATKNKLLRQVVGSNTNLDIASVQNRWDKFEILLESHQMRIKEQVDMLKAGVNNRRTALDSEVERFRNRWQQLRPRPEDVADGKSATKALGYLKDHRKELDELLVKAQQLKGDTLFFGSDVVEFTLLENLQASVASEEKNWSFFEEFSSELFAFRKEDWIGFRSKTVQLEEFHGKWLDRIRQRLSHGERDVIAVHMQRIVDRLWEMVPHLKFFRGDNWVAEHWGDLFRIIEIQGVGFSELTVGHLLDASAAVIRQLDAIKALNVRAQAEISIREALQELDVWGAGTIFSFTDLPNQSSTKNSLALIKDWTDLLNKIGDHRSLLQSLKDSPYAKNFGDKIGIWDSRLNDLDFGLQNLNLIQRKWIYLQPIFEHGSGQALPGELPRFQRIDNEFRSIMGFVALDPRVVRLLQYSNLKAVLPQLVEQLERCQKALNDYLEDKREKFARFYFVGDDDLLEILGQAKNPAVIQSHLKKLFAGIHSVVFSDDNRKGEETQKILAIRSAQLEMVTLNKPIVISGEVETWLAALTAEVTQSLCTSLQHCYAKYDIGGHPQQILDLVGRIQFTERVERILGAGGDVSSQLLQYQGELRRTLQQYSSFDYNTISDEVTRNVLMLKLKSLILDLIYFVDLLDELRSETINAASDWGWQRQLRYYLKRDFTCEIRQGDASFAYTFEYQGNPSKLVHTPLTDKCYLTLTCAMNDRLGGCPFGPAGTGKTESVKALGSLFGRMVLVFNCDEGLDYKSMGRIFTGIIKCGAWGCFDEFNRLEEIVLSAVSQQILAIQLALKGDHRTANLIGKDVELDSNSAIFVTLNPAGKGYGGRQKLPDNLKQMFRSICMTTPDNELIAQVLLLSEGFNFGKELGTKIISIMDMCKQLLSPQQHYDWGLRALKSILRLSGYLLQQHLSQHRDQPVSDAQEIQFVVESLKMNTLSKLTASDNRLFKDLLQDVFPQTAESAGFNNDLKQRIQVTCSKMGLMSMESQVDKTIQFYEALRQRMGVVVVGPQGSGKSSVIQILKETLSKERSVKVHYVSPKAIDRKILLGHMDLDTREWFDGVLVAAARAAVNEDSKSHTWIVLDGDIDPEWVEALNSVLDDNRLLTLPSGERIQFGSNVNFVFETHDLKYASPATVSRMGMIYLSDVVSVETYTASWIERLPEDRRPLLKQLVKDILLPQFNSYASTEKMVVPISKLTFLKNILSRVLQAENKQHFCLEMLKGFYANLTEESRLSIASELVRFAPDLQPFISVLHDCKWNVDGTKISQFQMTPLGDHIEQAQFQSTNDFPIVHTVAVQRDSENIRTWLDQGHPLLLTGSEGSGKQLILRNVVTSSLRSTNFVTVHCNAMTSAQDAQRILSQHSLSVTTNAGKLYRPKDAERLVIYFRDVHLPKRDKFGTVQLLSFVQQLIQSGGFFDSDLAWVRIENIQLVFSTTTVGSKSLPARFLGSLCHYTVVPPTSESLRSIYSQLCRSVARLILGNASYGDRIGAALVQMFDEVKRNFPITDHAHYTFTPRDLTRIIQSFGRYELDHTGHNSVQQLLDICAYEVYRVFGDRLVHQRSRKQLLDGVIFRGMQGTLDYRPSYDGKLVYLSRGRDSESTLSPVDPTDFKTAITKAIATHTRDHRDLNFSIHAENLDTIAAVYRALADDSLSLLMVGKAGTGRRAAVEIVANMQNMNVIALVPSRGYTVKSFSNDLKSAIQSSAITGTKTALIVESYQLVQPEFLQLINGLLSSCDVSRMFSKEELDMVLANMKTLHAEEGYQGSVSDFFAGRIRRYLRLVILLDGSMPIMYDALSENPALLSHCHVRWMESFSKESMLAEAQQALDPELGRDADTVRTLVQIHEIGTSSTHLAPLDFTKYLGYFQSIYKCKKDGLLAERDHYQVGLAKLNGTAEHVNTLKSEAAKQTLELNTKQREADEALKSISDSMVKANEQKGEMEDLTRALQTEEGAIQLRKQSVEKELESVEPLIAAARESVGEIRSEHLSEIRSMRAPPPVIRDVLEGVLRLMGIFDMSWSSMKTFLGKRTVKEEILNFNARNITPQIRNSVLELLRDKPESFDEAVVRRSSVAAAPLAIWVKANLEYSSVLEKIKPLEDDLKIFTRSLDDSRSKVQRLGEELSLVDEKVATLKQNFSEKTRAAEVLRMGLEKAQVTIRAAESMMDNLQGERQRWSTQVIRLEEKLGRLPIHTMLASAGVVYFGGLSESRRASLLGQMVDMFSKKTNFDLTAMLATESDILRWKQSGLPDDRLTIENIVIYQESNNVPFIVDPTGRISQWLSEHASSSKMEVVQQQDPNLSRSVELAVRFGKTLVIDNVLTIEPFLVPILRKDFIKQGPRMLIRFGDKSLDVNENFRVLMATRNPLMEVSADLLPYLTKLDFTTTVDGLKNQLLSVILNIEKPELESRRMALVSQEQSLKLELIHLEEQLLKELANAGDDILNNKSLVDSLLETKQKGSHVVESLEQAAHISKDIDREREKFAHLAEDGSRLFFVLSKLYRLNPMYHFRLPSFIRVFEECIMHENAKAMDSVESKTAFLSQLLKKRIYTKFSLGLVVGDRLSFALQMVHDLHQEMFKDNEWEFLMNQTAQAHSDKLDIPSWLGKDTEGYQTFKVGVVLES